MDQKRHIRCIKKARAWLAKARADCDLPQIEAILRSADMELHWALWNLGEVNGLRPEEERLQTP
jgi:hypothetical protein